MKLFWVVLFTVRGALAGNEVGANGDRISGWFTAQGYQILAELERRERAGTPFDKRITSAAFRKALKTRIVVVDKTNEAVITSTFGEVKDVKFDLDPKTSEPILLINGKTWGELYVLKKPDYQTVFHGYIYALRNPEIDDRRYGVSSKLTLPPSTVNPLPIFKRGLTLTHFITTPDNKFLAVQDFGTVIRLNENGQTEWTVPDSLRVLSVNVLLPLQNGTFFAAGRMDYPMGGMAENQYAYLIHMDAAGHVLWTKKFCAKQPAAGVVCMGDGIIDAYPVNEKRIAVLASFGTREPFTGIGFINLAEGSYEEPTKFIEKRYIRSLRATPDGGHIMTGFENFRKPRTPLKFKDHRFFVRKENSKQEVEWQHDLGLGKGRLAIALKSGKFAVVGQRYLGETTLGDIISEPVLFLIDEKGSVGEPRSLTFTDFEIEDPKRMGKTGEAFSLFEDAQGTLWISGSNNVFERQKRSFYTDFDDSYRLIERNGFIYRLNPTGSTHQMFPGTSELEISLVPDGSVILRGDRFFSKLFTSELEN